MRTEAPQQILIVDDYDDAANSLALLLAFWGYRPLVAHTAQDALAVTRRCRPGVALVELRLKGMDGCALVRQLRDEMPDAPHCIALTGQGDAASRRRAAESGFIRYLVKPGDPEQLRALLAQLH